MRIIRGKYKGKQLYPPHNNKVRPTTDFAKEGLFNILENSYYFDEISVLDLFSGTGNISFEFLSRACRHVTAVEISKKNFGYIKNFGENLFGKSLEVIHGDAFDFVKKYPLNFDIIFADPPFDLKNISEIPELIFGNKMIKKNVLLILEHSKKYNFSDNNFFKKSRKYGKINFSFFSNEIL